MSFAYHRKKSEEKKEKKKPHGGSSLNRYTNAEECASSLQKTLWRKRREKKSLLNRADGTYPYLPLSRPPPTPKTNRMATWGYTHLTVFPGVPASLQHGQKCHQFFSASTQYIIIFLNSTRLALLFLFIADQSAMFYDSTHHNRFRVRFAVTVVTDSETKQKMNVCNN